MGNLRYNFLLSTILIATSLVLPASGNEGLELPKPQYNWLHLGMGKFIYNSKFRASTEVGFSVLDENKLITIRTYVYFYLNGDSNKKSKHLFDEGYAECDILWGYCHKTQDYITAVTTGISFVFGQFGSFEFGTAGIPIVGQFYWIHSSLIGVGLVFFVNLNPKRVHSDATLCLQIGILN